MKTVWLSIHFAISFSCLVNFVENKKLQKSFEEMFGDGWHLKGMGEEGEEKEEEAKLAQIMARENEEQQKRSGEGHSNQKEEEANLGEEKEEEANLGEEKEEEAKLAQIMARENEEQQKRSGEGHSNHHSMTNKTDQNEEEENDQQKREIIWKFRAIKEKIKQKKGKQSHKEWTKIERTIAKKLGTNRDTIYKWIRELGMSQKWTEERKMAIMRQYWEMKQKEPKMSDEKIGKALKVSRQSISKWKGQFGELGMEMKRQLIIVMDERKRKIALEFQLIKKRIKQKERKYSHKQWDKMDKLLAKKLGTNHRYVYKWINEFGMLGMSQKWTNEGKLAIIRKYWKMKRNDPKISDRKIAKTLKINRRIIQRCKSQFEEVDKFGR